MRAAFAAHQQAVEACMVPDKGKKALQLYEGGPGRYNRRHIERGRILLTLTVSSEGAVEDVVVVRHTVTRGEQACLVEVARGVTVPNPTGATQTLHWPLVAIPPPPKRVVSIHQDEDEEPATWSQFPGMTPLITGPPSPEEIGLINGVMEVHAGQLWYCYQREKLDRPAEVHVDFDIQPRAPITAKTGNTGLEQCVAGRVLRMAFPPGVHTQGRLTLRFRPVP